MSTLTKLHAALDNDLGFRWWLRTRADTIKQLDISDDEYLAGDTQYAVLNNDPKTEYDPLTIWLGIVCDSDFSIVTQRIGEFDWWYVMDYTTPNTPLFISIPGWAVAYLTELAKIGDAVNITYAQAIAALG